MEWKNLLLDTVWAIFYLRDIPFRFNMTRKNRLKPPASAQELRPSARCAMSLRATRWPLRIMSIRILTEVTGVRKSQSIHTTELAASQSQAPTPPPTSILGASPISSLIACFTIAPHIFAYGFVLTAISLAILSP